MYSGARCIVFPSFYEGFGFPIVTALAYGKTLIARRSDLLQEIAAHCGSGRLIAFARRRSSSASSAVCCAGNRSRPSRSGLLRARRDGGWLRRMSYRSWTPGCGRFPESAGASATTRSTSCSPSARKGAYHILSMKIVSVASLPLSDVKVIRFARFMDDRGYFTEPFRRSDFDTHPEMEFLRGQSVQSNESYSLERGAWPALSVEPVHGKLVRTLHGHMVDIVLDIRKGSPSLGQAVLHDMPVSERALVRVDLGAARIAHGNFFEAESRIDAYAAEYSPGCEAGVSPLAGDIDWSLASGLGDSIPSPAASC